MQLDNIGTIAYEDSNRIAKVRFFNGLKEVTPGRLNAKLANNSKEYIIDVKTHDANKIARLLNTYKIETSYNGHYHQDRSYSQLICTSRLTEGQLDWLLWSKNVDYVGVVDND